MNFKSKIFILFFLLLAATILIISSVRLNNSNLVVSFSHTGDARIKVYRFTNAGAKIPLEYNSATKTFSGPNFQPYSSVLITIPKLAFANLESALIQLDDKKFEFSREKLEKLKSEKVQEEKNELSFLLTAKNLQYAKSSLPIFNNFITWKSDIAFLWLMFMAVAFLGLLYLAYINLSHVNFACLILVLLLPLAFYNWINLSQAILGEDNRPFITPTYYYFNVEHEDGSKTLAGDFSNVYYPAQQFFNDSIPSIYGANLDPFGRTPTYPPFTHFLYHFLCSSFSFGVAALIHLNTQIIVLLLSIFFILRKKVLSFLIAAAVIINLVFLTPTGLSWYERGQFDVYVAISFFWLIYGIAKEKYYPFILSALFCALKWTSLPCLFIILVVYLFCCPDNKRFLKIVLFGATFLAVYLVFYKYILLYPVSLAQHETIGGFPNSISLMQLMPDSWLLVQKAIPFFLTAVYIIVFSFMSKRSKEIFWKKHLYFFFLANAVLMTTYGTDCYGYRALSLFGFIPISLLFFKRAVGFKHLIALTLFFLIVLRVDQTFVTLPVYPWMIVLIYVVMFLVYILLAFNIFSRIKSEKALNN